MNTQKVVLITGASSGIGRATAELLSSRGYRVFGTARNPASAKPIAEVTMLPLDVRDDVAVQACVKAVLAETGRIDILINNAGYGIVGAVEETDPDEAQAMFDTNLFGVLRMLRAVLPIMRRQGAGKIINTSSILGFLPGPFFGLYASTKHALEALSESLDHEVRSFGIRIVLVEPDITNTSFGANWVEVRQKISDYANGAKTASSTMTKNIKKAAGPDTVAMEIMRAIERPHRMRRPVGFHARLLSGLRRFMPAGPVDRGIRKSFGLT
jgi:NAD(P)-dependent dehydrogenase (short-subunit alcohol dehydrogenase family)